MSKYRVVEYCVETKVTLYEKKMFGRIKKHENFIVGYYSPLKRKVMRIDQVDSFIKKIKVQENALLQDYFDKVDKSIREGKPFYCSNPDAFIFAINYEDRRVELDFKVRPIDDFTYRQIEKWANCSQLREIMKGV